MVAATAVCSVTVTVGVLLALAGGFQQVTAYCSAVATIPVAYAGFHYLLMDWRAIQGSSLLPSVLPLFSS